MQDYCPSTRKRSYESYAEAAEEANQATSFESLVATGMMDRQFASQG